MKKLHFFFAFLVMSFSLFGQEIKTTTSKKNINVGEPFNIKFEVEISTKDEIKVQAEKDSLHVFKLNEETKAKEKAYITILNSSEPKQEKIQGKQYWIFNYEVIAFEPATFFLPPKKFKINGKSIESNPVMIPITLVKKIKDVEFYDIQESYTELPSPFFENAKQVVIWGLLIIIILVLGLLYYFLIYKKQHKEEAIDSQPSGLERKKAALAELEKLMQQSLWEKDQLKEHFTEVSLITRRFLSHEMDQSFRERTSLETQLILRKKGLYESQLRPLGLILNVSDMVKFAKSSLGEEGVLSVYQETKKFIEDFQIN